MTQNLRGSLQGVMTSIAPVPPGIDPARLVLWEQRGKFSYEQVRGTLGAMIQSLNEERAIVWSDLIALTDESAVWYMNGGSIEPANITMGRTRPKLVRGNNAGHSIDLQVWQLAFGGSARDLEDMTESQLIGGVWSLATAMRDQFDYEVLSRAMTYTEVPLGSSGYSVGFCDASYNAGSGGPVYAPPKWNGKTFYEDHQHYKYYDSASQSLETAVNETAYNLAEHGLPVNTDMKMYVSETDVASYTDLENYVMPIIDVSPDRGGLTSGNIFYEAGRVGSVPQSGGRYFGSYRTNYGFVQLFSTPRIPTGYGFMYRPGAPFAANNALAVRYRPSTGFGCRLNEIPDYNTTFPIKEIDVEDEYGVSAGKNRFAGACFYIANGASEYVNPTISL